MAFDYHSRRWRRVREKALKLSGYQCQESKRYGVTREATTVHHIWPAEQYPEYAWCLWNLLPLTRENHDAMHDRASRQLTSLGEYWKRRPPPCERAEFSQPDHRRVGVLCTHKETPPHI